MQSNLVPLILLIGGCIAAVCMTVWAMLDPCADNAVLIGIACLAAVAGWWELRAGEDFNETLKRK